MVNGYDNVKFGIDARNKIIEGANLAADAVAVTYGPNGCNVLYRNGGLLKSTKDGASVIQVVNDKDPYIQMGIDIIKEASVNTAKQVGDGSTTVSILAAAIINSLKNENKNLILKTRELRKACGEIVEKLKQESTPIQTKEDLIKVATLAANNDEVIGRVVAEAFNKVGTEGLVTFQESNDVKDRIEYTEGFKIDSGYESPYFVNTPKNECVLEDVIIYISDTQLEDTKNIRDLAGKAFTEKKSLLLIAPEFDSSLTMFLVKNLFNHDGTPKLKACMVISPNFGALREIMLEDMRILFGQEMHCDKVVITQESTTFRGYHPNQTKLETRIQSIKDIINENALSEIEMNFHKKRLANFTSGMATIFVGGYSQVEMKERYDRFEDAIRATQCALEGGILPGGGTTLASIDNEVFGEILKTPINKLNTNIKTKEDAFKNNVIEPFLVVKATLENAVAVATTILTTNCTILNV